MEFKTQKNGSALNAEILIVSYDRSIRSEFPEPYTTFILEIDGQKYETSIRNLKSGTTSMAKTYDKNGNKVTRADLCSIHSLIPGQRVCIEAIVPKQKYRLTRSS